MGLCLFSVELGVILEKPEYVFGVKCVHCVCVFGVLSGILRSNLRLSLVYFG